MIDPRTYCVFEYDDWPYEPERCLSVLDHLRTVRPKFKAAIFAIPEMMTDDAWRPLLERRDWIEVGIHGAWHTRGEFRRPHLREQSFASLDRALADPRFARTFKAPHFGYDAAAVARLAELSVVHCVKSSTGYPFPNTTAPVYCAWDVQRCRPPRRWESHPFYEACGPGRMKKARRTAIGWKQVDSIMRNTTVETEWRWPSEAARPALVKINLGCEHQLWPGWISLDHRPTGPGVWPWKFGAQYTPESMIPVGDNWADVVHQSHVFCYYPEERYTDLLLEVWRVLRPGGVFRIADDQADIRVWRQPGRAHFTGDVNSLPTRAKIKAAAERVGFAWRDTVPGDTASPHADVLAGDNRPSRYRRGHKFYAELTKAIDIPDLARVRAYDPRCQRGSRPYRLPAGAAGEDG